MLNEGPIPSFQSTDQLINQSTDLPVTQRIAFRRKNIIFDVHPKSKKEVYNYWRAHRNKRDVNKVLPDGRRCDTHFIAQPGANTEYVPFYEMFETLHWC
jgi:hypothetical protein